MDGERARSRTWDLLVKSQLLYRLSYAPTHGLSPVCWTCARQTFDLLAQSLDGKGARGKRGFWECQNRDLRVGVPGLITRGPGASGSRASGPP